MNTQQFRTFFRLRTVGSILIAALPLLFFTVGCEEEGESTYFDAELTPSNRCKTTCPSGMGCFEDPVDPTGDPSCFELNCPDADPTIACADGAVCEVDSNGAGRCVLDFVCTPECTGNTHCAGGHCIPNYTSQNVCDPLIDCRNRCGGADPACLQACEHDRSSACTTCQRKLTQCRTRESCEPSATGCCSETYCECYPGSAECRGETPCATCWNNCADAGDRVECLATCAGGSPTCATCLQPFIEECSESSTDLSSRCEDLFEQCTGSKP